MDTEHSNNSSKFMDVYQKMVAAQSYDMSMQLLHNQQRDFDKDLRKHLDDAYNFEQQSENAIIEALRKSGAKSINVREASSLWSSSIETNFINKLLLFKLYDNAEKQIANALTYFNEHALIIVPPQYYEHNCMFTMVINCNESKHKLLKLVVATLMHDKSLAKQGIQTPPQMILNQVYYAAYDIVFVDENEIICLVPKLNDTDITNDYRQIVNCFQCAEYESHEDEGVVALHTSMPDLQLPGVKFFDDPSKLLKHLHAKIDANKETIKVEH